MKRKSTLVWGFILVGLGLLLIADQLNLFRHTWELLLPAALLFIGIGNIIAFYAGKRTSPGMLVSAGILLVYGLLFLACVLIGWGILHQWWPLFILGPGVGLLLQFLLAGRGSVLPSFILSVLTALFLLRNLAGLPAIILVAALLVAAGIVIIVRGLLPAKPAAQPPAPTDTATDTQDNGGATHY